MTAKVPRVGHWLRWPDWVAYAAGGWSLLYAALGLYWWRGGVGFPFGRENDPAAAHLSALADVHRSTTAPAIVTFGLLAVAVAMAMARQPGVGVRRVWLLIFAWMIAAVLALVVPDYRLLIALTSVPVLIAAAVFHLRAEAHFAEAVTWPVLNQLLCLGGALLWAATAAAYEWRSRGANLLDARRNTRASWSTASAAERWGTWAVAIASVPPLLFAVTRWMWALGWPLGIDGAFYRAGQASGLWWRGATLGALAAAGAALTLGLAQHWGEVFPRWLPYVGRRTVPALLAIIPAAFVSLLITESGLMFIRQAFTGTFTIGDRVGTFHDNWAVVGPELLWPVWGVALGFATLAYYFRRRTTAPSHQQE